jgi:hypothetical protein
VYSLDFSGRIIMSRGVKAGYPGRILVKFSPWQVKPVGQRVWMMTGCCRFRSFEIKSETKLSCAV